MAPKISAMPTMKTDLLESNVSSMGWTMCGILVSIMVSWTPLASAEERTWTRSEILTVTDAEATRLGYDVERMSVAFDVHNTTWESYHKTVEPVGGTAKQDEELKDRHYLAVYYASLNPMTKGGDFWVFLDLQTGQVTEVVVGE